MSSPEPPYPPRTPPGEPTEPLRRSPPLQPRTAVPPPAAEYAPVPPEPYERPPWRENPWPAILTALIALVIGGFVGYLIGENGNNDERERPRATVTHTTTVERPKTVVQTHTVTASTVKETPNQSGEARRQEAESNLRNAEQENKELRKKLEESGASP